MSNVTTNTVLSLVVGSTGQGASALPASPALLGPGKVGAYKPNGTLAVGTDTKFFIARGGATPGKFMRTDVIDMTSNNAYAAAKAGVAAQAQITHIGYNGTTGALDLIADNLYYVRFYLQEFLGSASDARIVKHAVYKSTSTPTGKDLALGLANSCNVNFSNDPEQKIHALPTNNTGTAVAIAAITVTNKSNVVTLGAAPSVALVVGDLIRVGTTEADGVMVITKVISTTAFEVANTWYGQTQTVAGQSVVVAQQGADWGVRFEGLALDWRRGHIFNSITMFDVAIEDFGSTEITLTQGASKGILTGREVADLETFAQGYYGEQYRVGEPALFEADAFADPSLVYDGWRYHTVNDEVVGIGATPTSKKEFLCVLPASESGSTIATLLTALLT